MNELVFRMRILTDLEVENVSSVVRLNKYDLVFVRQVQRLGVVLLDGEVESGNTTFHLGQEFGMFAIVAAIKSVRLKPFWALPPGAKMELLSIETETACSEGT